RWVQQFGTSQPEFAGACGVDSFGGVYFVGFGSGGLFTTTYSGYWGVYVLRAASSSGVTTWGHNTNVGKSEQFLYAQALNYDPFVCGVWSTGGEVWGAAASWSGGQLPAGRGLVVLPPVNGSSTVPLVVISFWTDDTTSFVDQPVTGAGGFDSIVAAYNGLTGAFVWSDTYATPYDDMAYGIATDPTGAVWVTGYTSANLDGGAYSGTPNSQTDVFLSKLTLNGTKLFTVLYGSATNSEAGTAVASDSAGGIYVAGVSAYAATTVMMDAQPNPYTAVTSSMSGSAVVGFLSKFDSDGARLLTYLLSAYTPVTQANAVTPFLAPLSLAADTKSGAVYLSGRLEGLWGAETYPSGTASLTDIMCDQAFLVSVQQPPTNCSILQFDQLLTQINSLLAQL
ncbi:hypothetical protein MMC34_008517, partial [Xylographa carneopallida]|nr:hypothetical protein [Xylographa carneopallida]